MQFILEQRQDLWQTIRLFISEWDERCDWRRTKAAEHGVVWSSWAGDHSELSCVHLNGEWQFHALIVAFLACPPDWAQGPPLIRDERGLTLPGCQTILHVLQIFFSRLLMLPSFQPLSSNSLNSLRAPYCFWQTEIFNQNCMLLRNFMILF